MVSSETSYAFLYNISIKEKTNMKFQMIAAADVDIIREARKALKRLQKRVNKLDEKREAALGDRTKDYDSIAMEEYRLLDELTALHIHAANSGDMWLEA